MSEVCLSAERVMQAPADVVYRCIADYQRHHRPEGFLPPAFTAMHVEHGGIGTGTEPGRLLVEAGDGASTTFTVQPDGQGCRVRIESVLDMRGLAGSFTGRFAPGLLRPVYADELRRLEQYARALMLGIPAAVAKAPPEEGPAPAHCAGRAPNPADAACDTTGQPDLLAPVGCIRLSSSHSGAVALVLQPHLAAELSHD